LEANLKDLIRSIPDFPKPGILFRDITTLLKDGPGFRSAVHTMASHYRDAHIDKVVCIEPDISYHTFDIGKLLYSDLDIASGYSFLPQGMGVADWIYDSWATRVNPEDSEYFGPHISALPDCLPVASTFNCFCVYKIFIKNIS